MAGNKLSLRLLCLFLLLGSGLASKLNVPRVLLPIFNDFSTNFLLEAHDGGCYTWTTIRSDIIKLTPIDENHNLHCSHKALVSTITKEPVRNLAVVLAEDVETDQVLKCDVVVDVINNLSITTTTRELFMEEVPEAFQLNAYDDQGNEFSTLEGIEFDWNIISMGPKKETVVVRYLSFKDSPYEAPAHIEALEEANKKGSIILLEGVKTGTAKISVRLPYKDYKNVPSVDVSLTVTANLLLTPGEAYMMSGDVITFKLFYMHNGRMEEIAIPDAQYYLESEDSNILFSDKNLNTVTAKNIGVSKIFLKSSNVHEDDVPLKLPSAIIHVVEPAYIVLSILPHKNWAVLIGDQHQIIAEVYSSTDHKIFVGSGVEIHLGVAEAFHVEERSRNGSWLTGWGVKESRALVQAKLESITHPDLGKILFENPISAQSEVYIYPRITLSPPEVVLPWDPQVRPKYEIDVTAKGGDGRFLWSSSDHSIGIVSQNGHVRTHNKGFFDVSAAMTRNHHNRQIARFSILPPVRLEIVEYIMEAEVNEPIYIHIALYALKLSTDNTSETYIPFTHCQDLPFQVKQSDNKFIYNKTATQAPVGLSCGTIAMIGTAVGTSKITISHYQDGLTLEDSVTISAYTPLKLISPRVQQKFVLAVGSSGHLIYTGGPRPQIGRQSEHQRIVNVESEAIAQAEDVTSHNFLPNEDTTAVYVLCRKLGETIVKLTISNTPSLPNCKSLGSNAIVKVICGKPRKLHIQPEIKVSDTQSCPMDLSSDRIVVPNKQNIELEVIVYDELGRPFLNATSLQFAWTSKPLPQVIFQSADGVLDKYEMFGTIPMLNKTQQIVRPLQESGLVEITGTVVAYKMSILNAYHITPEWPEFRAGNERESELAPITASIGLFLVDDTVASPNTTIVFNQINVKKEVSILHGSGYVELSLSTDNVAIVNYKENTRVIEIVPLNSGDLTIQLLDLCLVANPVFIHVKVVSLGRIDVETAGKVEINHCIEVIVKLYDETDQLLDVSDLGKVDLRHRFTKSIANLGRMPQNVDDPWPRGEIHYVMTGVELGDARLMFSFDNKDQVVTSNPVEIQVFPPLKVNPRNGTLLIGSTLQLTLKGGPQPDTNIEFSPFSTATIGVSDLGIVKGKELGSTRITVRSIGVHPKTGEKIIYAEDTVDIVVVQISGINIAAPLARFKVGSTVPVWVTGIPESISPLTLASFEDGTLSYSWDFTDSDCTTRTDIFSPVGIMYKNSDASIIRVIGIQPGKTKLSLNVSIAFDERKYPRMFHASIDIEVVEAMALLQPLKYPGSSLLMSRHSFLQLKTNLDVSCQMEYSIPEHRLTGTEITSVNATPVATITVTETGYLQAYGSEGFAELLITATDEYGLRQTLSYVVEVKPVSYMMLQVKADWRIHLDSPLQVLPIGTGFDMIANFYDNIGNKFVAGPRQLKVRANRLDLIKVKVFSDNATVQVRTRRPGHTVIKAWTDGVDNTADYAMIHAEEVVKPVVNFLTSGDIMCLWSPVVTRHLQTGEWSSNDPNTLVLDPSINLALVVGNREATVLLTHSLHSHVPLRLQVLPVAEVALHHEMTYFTNGMEGSVQRIGVVLRNRIGPTDKWNNLIQGWLCDRSFNRYIVPAPFRCFISFTNDSVTLDPQSVFSLKSDFDASLGQYSCKVTSTGFNLSEASLLITNVSLWAISDEGDIESEQLNLPFIPSVYAAPELPIGDDGNFAQLIVTGLKDVLQQISVKPSDSSVVFVDGGRFLDDNHKAYQVHLIDYHSKFADVKETMGIIIRSPMTDQISTVLVQVSSRYRDETCSRKPLYLFIQEYKHSIIIVISMLIIFFTTCYIYSRWMQPILQLNVQSRRSMISPSNVQHPAAYNLASSTPLNRTYNSQITRLSPTSPICTNKTNCTCGKNPEPVYGDVSTFALSSPELRRNRRFL